MPSPATMPAVTSRAAAAKDNVIAIAADAVGVVVVTGKAIVANAMSVASELPRVQRARCRMSMPHAKHAKHVNRVRIAVRAAKTSVKVDSHATAAATVDAMVEAKAGATARVIRRTRARSSLLRRQAQQKAATQHRRRIGRGANAVNAAASDVIVASVVANVVSVASAANAMTMRRRRHLPPTARYRCAATTTRPSTALRRLKAAISKRITARSHKPRLPAARA